MAGWRVPGLALIALVSGISTAAPVWAQQKTDPARIPVDPKALTFGVSPDHDAPADSGRQVVKYLIEFMPVEGMGSPRELDLGRPDAPDGVITVSLAQAKLSPGRYLATVRAVNVKGAFSSETVGPFQIGRPKPPREAPTVNAPPPEEEDDRPRGKRGFWRRVYDKIVG